MELINITELTEQLGLSSRTLRYYEQVGLIESVRPKFEKYRYFDEKNVERLRQIIVLRKMQISIRDIQHIYESEDMSVLVETFVKRISEIDEEVTVLSDLKQIIDSFLQKMLQSGITKISALPLLYDEMSKRLEVKGKSNQVDMTVLDSIDNQLHKTVNVRIVKLAETDMLCSRKKGTEISDIDGFWDYLSKCDVLNSFEEHTLFELYGKCGQPLVIAKKTELLSSDDYEDFRFTGGVFAVASTYADDDLESFVHLIIDSFDSNKFYQVDYKKCEQLVLAESVLSPDGRRDMIDVFVPLKQRLPDTSYFNDEKRLSKITVREIEDANPILTTTVVKKFTPIDAPFYRVDKDGITEFIAYISVRTLSTDVAVKIPFRVDIEFKIDDESASFGYGADEGSIRIDYGNSYFGINMDNNPDKRLSQEAIKFTEPILANVVTLPKLGRIKQNEYNKLTWIIGEKHFAVIINGEVRYCVTDMPYMKMDLRLQKAYTVIIGSNGQGKRYIKSVSVSQLKQSPRLKIKGGNINMSTTKSNNTIPNIHQVITMHYGENYWFNGCANYVMECLDEPNYNYGFFAGLTGDNFTQIYYKDSFYGDSATDYLIKAKGGAYIEELFDKIGYACTYVPNKKLKSNREMYLQTLIAYIDKGVPVIRYHWFWSVIVGYEDFGKTLLVMNSDKTEPEKIPFEDVFSLTDKTSDKEADEYGYGWFFVGSRTREVALKDIYRTAVKDILPRLTINNDKFCFGAEAFRAWAADIESGKFDNMKPEDFDDWPYYTNFVCNLATNSDCGRDFLIKAMELNPDLEFLSDVMRMYQRTGDMWNNQGGEDLEGLGGGFNITLEALQDREKRAKIVAKLKELATCADKIIEIFRENTDENGELAPKKRELDDTDIKHFKTINTTDWKPSPFVPKFSGKKADDKDVNGENTQCWYIDSRQGKWSTVYSTLENVKAGDKVRLLFWAKFAKGGHHELILWVTQNDWEKHAEFYMNECKPHMLCRQGEYCLFSAVYTAVADETVQFSLSANDVIVSIFPAKESDLELSNTDVEVKMPDYRIEKCYKEAFPKCRFVGKCYKNSDRVDGMYGYYWGQWHENGWFEPLEKLITKPFKKAYPDCEAYVGLMKCKNGASEDYFEYWIGMFLPADCKVPDGYGYVDIDHEAAGICWIKGQEQNVYCREGDCYNELVKNDMVIPSEADGGCYMFERYVCPRFTTPDESGEIVLDLGFFVEKQSKVKDISELKYKENKADSLEYFNLPDARVIGKSFRIVLNRHGAKNPIPKFWKDCEKEGLMEVCNSLPKLIPAMLGFTDDYDEKTGTFLYIAGVLCPKDTPVPVGYAHRDIPATIVSKSKYKDWLKECKPVWENDGYEWSGADGQFWNAELYLDGEDNKKFRLLCAVMKKSADDKKNSNEANVKIVNFPACTVAGGYQTQIDKPEQFYNFTGEEMKAILSLSDKTSSYFFAGSNPMHIFGGVVAHDKQVEQWMIKRNIPQSEYVYCCCKTKAGEPYNEEKLQAETWNAINAWMDSQTKYTWSDNEDVPAMIVASTEDIGYNLYKAIKKR